MPDTPSPRSHPPPPGWVSLQVLMPRELHAALKHLAVDRATSVAEIVRGLVEQEIRSAR